jgi:DinB superfamily
MVNPPTHAEHNPYFSKYISLVPEGDILEMLQNQLGAVFQNLEGLSGTQLEHRYAPGKWSVLQVVRHLVDTERVFTFRATHIARRDSNPLSSFDQDVWMKHAPSSDLAALLPEWMAVRQNAVTLFVSLSQADWTHIGIAGDSPLSPKVLTSWWGICCITRNCGLRGTD